MRVVFFQGFTKRLKIVYLENEQKQEMAFIGLTEEGPTVNEIVEQLNAQVNESEIAEVILVGKTKTLRELENYYKNIEGVTITWQ